MLRSFAGFNGFYNNILDFWLTVFFTLEGILKAGKIIYSIRKAAAYTHYHPLLWRPKGTLYAEDSPASKNLLLCKFAGPGRSLGLLLGQKLLSSRCRALKV